MKVVTFTLLFLSVEMKLKNYIIGLIMLLMVMMPDSVQATHFMGADITYICGPAPLNNPCIRRILHKTYYDCDGAATPDLTDPNAPNTLNPQFSVVFQGQGCGTPTLVGAWVFVSYSEVTPICPDTTTKCTDVTQAINGVNEAIYYADYDFCALPNGCVVNISWSNCCRNNTITSLTAPGSDGMYVSTNVTVGLTPCNSSPQFNFRPVPYLCLGTTYTFNQGATDPDGDSLSYALVPCLTSATNTVSYNGGGGYNPASPLGPNATVTINPQTGDVTILPNTIEIGVMCVEVTEWRNGVAINTVTRDMQLTVINCTGNPPTSTGINGLGSFITTACGGDLICFDIPSDGDPTRIVTMSWNNGIAGGVFTSSNGTQIDTVRGNDPTGRFCWQTSPNQIGQYQFVLTLVDDNCPIQLQNQYTFQINITPPQPITITGNTSICRGQSTNLTTTGGGSSFTWTPTTGLSNPNIQNPVFTPDTTTTYCVTSGGGLCPLVSECVTVIVNDLPVATTCADTFTCEGSGGVPICASVTGGASPYIYIWNPNNGSLSDANILNPIANPDSTTTYSFYAIGDNGCVSNTATQLVTVYPLPRVNAGPNLAFCENSPGVFLQGQITNAIGGYDVHWIPSTGLFCDTCLVTYAVPPVNTIYTLYARSRISGCQSDSTTLNPVSTTTVTVKPRPIVFAGLDTAICQLDSANLYGTVTNAGPNYTYSWSPSTGMTSPTLLNPKASPPHSMDYFLVATSNGCESIADTITVVVNPIPVLSAGSILNMCEGDSVQLPGLSQPGMASVFRWVPGNSLNDSTLVRPMASPAITTNYTLTAYNQFCPSLPSFVTVLVHPVPKVTAGNDTILCSDADSITLQGGFIGGTAPFFDQWNPTTGLNYNFIPNPKAKPVTSLMYYYSVTSGTGVSQCTGKDSVLITVVPAVTGNLVGDTTIICPGEQVHLQAAGGRGSATFNWTPSTGLNTTQGPSVYASPIDTTTYILIISEAGCADTLSYTIEVNPQPDAEFTMSQPVGCSPLNVQFDSRSDKTLTWVWNFGDGTPISNEVDPSHYFTTPGTYQVRLIALTSGSCADTAYSSVPVVVTPPLMADFVSNPSAPVELSEPNTIVSFRDKTVGANQWFWDFGDGITAEGANPIHQFTQKGTYMVTLKVNDSNGCEAVIKKGPFTIFTPELNLPNVFSPNGDGVNDLFFITYTGDESFRVQIFDRWGVKYFDTLNRNQFWNGQDLNGQIAADGTYFYTIQIGGRNYSGSVTIVR
ncbi:MAG: PKD domain-containing protein [Sphingobacteriia bacterium]|nr:PKD domain-containing protein [Sphingobacteriia bacterium]